MGRDPPSGWWIDRDRRRELHLQQHHAQRLALRVEPERATRPARQGMVDHEVERMKPELVTPRPAPIPSGRKKSATAASVRWVSSQA